MNRDALRAPDQPPARWTGLSIRHSLPLLISALAAGALAIFAAAAYIEVREAAVDAARTRLTTVTDQLASMVTTGVATYAPPVVTAASAPEIAVFLRAPGAGADIALPEASATIYGAELRDRDMRRIVASRSDLPGGNDADLQLRPVLARSTTGAVGSIRAIGDSLVIPVAAAIRDGDRSLGYLVVWRRLSSTGQSDVEKLVGSDAQMYVANETGDLWTDLSQPVPAPPADIRGTRGLFEIERQQLGTSLAALSAIPGAPWVVVVEMPRAEIISHAQGMLRTFTLLGVFALLLAALGTWALAGRFTAPIMELADTAQAFSAGDYSRRSTVSRRDEIGTLSRAFNGMADNVAFAHSALETKVTELAQLEARHRDVGERLQQVLAASPDVIYEMELTADGPAFTWISDNVERLLGARADIVRQPGWWTAHLHPDDHVPPVPPPEQFGTDGEARREYRIQFKDGSYLWIRDRQRLVEGDHRLVGAWSDVTALRSLEEQFRQAQKLEAVGRLAGGVAHDFNNIVTVILGESDMALSALPPQSAVSDSLNQVRTAAERASLLTRQLLTFSRNQLTESTIFNPGDVVQDLRGMLGRLIGEDIDLQYRLDPDLDNVCADRSQVEQVLVNLVINARDAMPDGGTIVIQTHNVVIDDAYARSRHLAAPGDFVALVVSDTGTGMSAEVLEHLFEPFFTTKGPGNGTGLGLATSYGIARRFGGHIGVYSEAGVGTTMKLYLPRAEGADPGAPARPAPTAMARGTERILLVEDEAQVRAVVARMLRAQGYHVIVASNGSEALEAIENEREPIDLLLTDVVMPRMGGRDLADRVRTLRPDLRVLFTSGYTEDVIVQNRLLDHDIVLLHKPFTRLDLATKVREVLDAPPTSG